MTFTKPVIMRLKKTNENQEGVLPTGDYKDLNLWFEHDAEAAAVLVQK